MEETRPLPSLPGWERIYISPSGKGTRTLYKRYGNRPEGSKIIMCTMEINGDYIDNYFAFSLHTGIADVAIKYI